MENTPTTEELKIFFTEYPYEGQLHDKITSYMTSLVCERLGNLIEVNYNPNSKEAAFYKMTTKMNVNDFRENAFNAFNELLNNITDEMIELIEKFNYNKIEISTFQLTPILSNPDDLSLKRATMIKYKINE